MTKSKDAFKYEKEKSITNDQFATDVSNGLNSQPKTLHSKYFYDDIGSQLFQKITQHQDYYLTRTELEIISAFQHQLPEIIAESELDIIELGVGDGHKTQLIIDGFLAAGCSVNYYPIDISRKAMDLLQANINPHQQLKVNGVVAEYIDGLKSARKKSTNKQLVLFVGSNIGNFSVTQSQKFLEKICECLNPSDHILIGFDLKKAPHTLTAAYNDSSGHTKDFNLNLLSRMNRELGANFKLENFEHLAIYNPLIGAMESYLLATKAHDVHIATLDRTIHFESYEPIHMEFSFKFSKSDIDSLSETSGFEVIQHFTDSKQYFIDALWKVAPKG